MIVKQLIVGPLLTNCYIAACEDTLEGVVIDPGDDAPRILGEIEANNFTIKYVLNTHAHFDHIGANEIIRKRLNAPLALHPLDIPLLKEKGGAMMFGLDSPQGSDPDLELEEGMVLKFGTCSLKVLLTPGHTPGHVSFFAEEAKVLFDGDVLFDGGIGRTDLPGGSMTDIMYSINEVLFKLPDETIVYSGHGNPTTIGQEKATNPWLV
ncbi:MAG: MBL fold metallo-hydrolase [Spirochaetales bacterium]|nr:MBL fold metallo-hydrolase [Spirochaetales bacterium]